MQQQRPQKQRRRLSFPRVEYQIHIQPLPFTLPLHGSPCACANHFSYVVLSSGDDVVSEVKASELAPSESASDPSDPSPGQDIGKAAKTGATVKGAKACVLKGLQCAHDYEIKVPPRPVPGPEQAHHAGSARRSPIAR